VICDPLVQCTFQGAAGQAIDSVIISGRRIGLNNRQCADKEKEGCE
jgi:hypothetical protein